MADPAHGDFQANGALAQPSGLAYDPETGRIFFADPEDLGEFLLVDYMKNRRARA